MKKKQYFNCTVHEAKYQMCINHHIFEMNEFSCVEIAVSFIRAYADVMYIQNSRPAVFRSAEWLALKIMDKEHYGMQVSLKKSKISVFLFKIFIAEFFIEEFSIFTEQIYDFLNFRYGKGIINLHEFAPSYLEHMLGVDLPYLIGAEYEKQPLLSLELYHKQNPETVLHINEHEYYQQFKTGCFSSSSHTNYLFESDEERFRRILTEVSDSRLQRKYQAVVYNDELFVRDGMHRIACLYYLYGNIKIPVLRMRFSKSYISYSLYRRKNNKINPGGN